jgi:hypothetical protein
VRLGAPLAPSTSGVAPRVRRRMALASLPSPTRPDPMIADLHRGDPLNSAESSPDFAGIRPMGAPRGRESGRRTGADQVGGDPVDGPVLARSCDSSARGRLGAATTRAASSGPAMSSRPITATARPGIDPA